jgi:hypothetical protein
MRSIGRPGTAWDTQVAVYLIYAGRRGHAAVDRELCVPRSWTFAPGGRRDAGLGEEIAFTNEPELATCMIGRFLTPATTRRGSPRRTLRRQPETASRTGGTRHRLRPRLLPLLRNSTRTSDDPGASRWIKMASGRDVAVGRRATGEGRGQGPDRTGRAPGLPLHVLDALRQSSMFAHAFITLPAQHSRVSEVFSLTGGEEQSSD